MTNRQDSFPEYDPRDFESGAEVDPAKIPQSLSAAPRGSLDYGKMHRNVAKGFNAGDYEDFDPNHWARYNKHSRDSL